MRLLTIGLCVFISGTSVLLGTGGRYVGTPVTKWLEDNRRMELLEKFGYIDSAGREWDAPKGWIIDGASIPQGLWTIVGSPFTGAYRNASIIHDVACDRRDREWEAVHRMFYDAMLDGGVGETRALFMYGAVYHFGPRWEAPRKRGFGGIGGVFGRRPQPPPPAPPIPATEEDFERLRKAIEEDRTATTLRQVEQLRVR